MTPAAPPSDVINRIHRSFRRGLASYHSAAVAQAQIAKLLVDAMVAADAPKHFSNALEFGCGTGHLTTQILQNFTVDTLILNDLVAESAAALLPILESRKTDITFQASAIETLSLPANLDLIASASTLQWVQKPAALLKSLAAKLSPGGWLALSSFGQNHFAELQSLGGTAKAPSYLDPDELRAILPTSLRVHLLEHHAIALEFPDAISLLRHLRLTGVNAGAHRHWTRTDLVDFERNLRALHPQRAELVLTYCPVILVAQKID